LSASEAKNQIIHATLVLGQSESRDNETALDKKNTEDSWKRFGIKSTNDSKIIWVSRAIIPANQQIKQNEIDWRNMPPLSIQESGQYIDPNTLHQWGVHQDFIKHKLGGMVYRFPDVLPTSLLVDENDTVKKEIILNFPVGNEQYEAHLTIFNPEKLHKNHRPTLLNIDTSISPAQKQTNSLKTMFGGFLTIAMVVCGMFYMKSC